MSSGRRPSLPATSSGDNEIGDILDGGIGRQNIETRGVALARAPYVPARSGALRHNDGFENLDAQLIEVTMPVAAAAATADVEILHGLGRVPAGFLVASCDQQGIIVAGTPDGKTAGNGSNAAPWTTRAIFLRAHSTLAAPSSPVLVRLLVF